MIVMRLYQTTEFNPPWKTIMLVFLLILAVYLYSAGSRTQKPDSILETAASPTNAAGEPASNLPATPSASTQPVVSGTAEPTVGGEEDNAALAAALAQCGDGKCDPDETCSSCGDCACSEGAYCAAWGACVQDVCGDFSCSKKEKASGSCCTDCGCAGGKACDVAENSCILAAAISSQNLDAVVQSFIANSTVNYTVSSTADDVLDGIAVKVVSLSCPSANYTCATVLFIDAQGTILRIDEAN